MHLSFVSVWPAVMEVECIISSNTLAMQGNAHSFARFAQSPIEQSNGVTDELAANITLALGM